VESFHRDGFLIIDEGFISDAAIEALRERFDRLFAGEYARRLWDETGGRTSWLQDLPELT
jgi:hypothetical protein